MTLKFKFRLFNVKPLLNEQLGYFINTYTLEKLKTDCYTYLKMKGYD